MACWEGKMACWEGKMACWENEIETEKNCDAILSSIQTLSHGFRIESKRIRSPNMIVIRVKTLNYI
jgi:hypothetical protein